MITLNQNRSWTKGHDPIVVNLGFELGTDPSKITLGHRTSWTFDRVLSTHLSSGFSPDLVLSHSLFESQKPINTLMSQALRRFVPRAPRYVLRPNDNKMLRFAPNKVMNRSFSTR